MTYSFHVDEPAATRPGSPPQPGEGWTLFGPGGLQVLVVLAEPDEPALALTEPHRAFVYLDPPFYHKADRLYRHHFDDAEHARLADGVAALAERGVPFLLSYDDADEVAALYADRGLAPSRIELVYSATGKGGPAPAAELVVSNLPVLPEATRVWRTQAEWMAGGDGQASQAPPAVLIPQPGTT